MSETGSGSDVVSMKLRAEKGEKDGEEGYFLSALSWFSSFFLLQLLQTPPLTQVLCLDTHSWRQVLDHQRTRRRRSHRLRQNRLRGGFEGDYGVHVRPSSFSPSVPLRQS
jgi:hypothetical protein